MIGKGDKGTHSSLVDAGLADVSRDVAKFILSVDGRGH
jgi:hypothetical protein